jgi:hypothetical protein
MFVSFVFVLCVSPFDPLSRAVSFVQNWHLPLAEFWTVFFTVTVCITREGIILPLLEDY